MPELGTTNADPIPPKHKEPIMATLQKQQTNHENPLLESIRQTAHKILRSLSDGDVCNCCMASLLSELREQLHQARASQIPESRIQEFLDWRRAVYTDVEESWDAILDHIDVYVWLEDDNANHVTSNTVQIDRILWSNGNEGALLWDAILELHDDLSPGWEVV